MQQHERDQDNSRHTLANILTENTLDEYIALLPLGMEAECSELYLKSALSVGNWTNINLLSNL